MIPFVFFLGKGRGGKVGMIEMRGNGDWKEISMECYRGVSSVFLGAVSFFPGE